MYKRIIGIGSVVIFGLSACKKGAPVVAQVDSEKITADEFQREISNQPFAQQDYLNTEPGRKEFLELLVRRKVLLSEAQRAGLPETADVKKKLSELEAEIEKQRQEARERILVGELLRTLQQKDLKVTDEEVRTFYDKEKESKASHILLSDLGKAQEIRQQLDKGESFEALARKHSEDAATGRQGGDLNFIMKGMLIPEFENALFALKTGEISDVVLSPYGYHIIKKTGERNVSARPFEELADPIRSVLEKQKFQAWIDQSRQRHKVVTHPEALQKIEKPAEPEKS